MEPKTVLQKLLLSVFAIFATTAHAQFHWGPLPTVPLDIPHSPEAALLVKRVAFATPTGNCAEQASELIDRIILPDFQANQIDVVERESLNQILAEHRFSQGGDVDSNSAVALGRILGPSSLLIVTVNSCTSEQIPLYTDTNQGRVYTAKTRVILVGSLRIVSLMTGQILGSHPFDARPEKENHAGGGLPEYPPADEVKEMAMRDAGTKIHNMFFPSIETVQLVFYDDKDCGLKQALDVYRTGNHEGALKLIESDIDACKNDPKKSKYIWHAYYDEGVIQCELKDFAKASELFTSVVQNKNADPVPITAGACQRSSDGSASVQRYLDKLAAVPPPAPIGSQPALTAASKSSAAPTKPSATTNAEAGSVEDRIKKLDSLLRKGLITRKEYDARKAAILNSI
jgi:hypothetical protein